MKNRKYLRFLYMSVLAGVFILGIGELGFSLQGGDGFRGLRWGAPAEDLAPRELIEQQNTFPDTTMYRKVNDRLSYGRAKLAEIKYGFTRNRLTSVTLRVDSYLQYLLLKEEAFAEFGEGSEVQGKAEDYAWNGKKVEVRLVSNFTKT